MMKLNNFFKPHCWDTSNSGILSRSKIRPMYAHELARYPHLNPVFITAESYSLYFMRRFQFNCLFCQQSIDHYDLNFSFDREVWVLYSRKAFFAKTMRLAQAIQLSGASKILLIKISTN